MRGALWVTLGYEVRKGASLLGSSFLASSGTLTRRTFVLIKSATLTAQSPNPDFIAAPWIAASLSLTRCTAPPTMARVAHRTTSNGRTLSAALRTANIDTYGTRSFVRNNRNARRDSKSGRLHTPEEFRAEVLSVGLPLGGLRLQPPGWSGMALRSAPGSSSRHPLLQDLPDGLPLEAAGFGLTLVLMWRPGCSWACTGINTELWESQEGKPGRDEHITLAVYGNIASRPYDRE